MEGAPNDKSSLFWSKKPADKVEDEKQSVPEENVPSVDDFSSQYRSLSLQDGPANFPAPMDYPRTFDLRTHGSWWNEPPSGIEDYIPRNNMFATQNRDFVGQWMSTIMVSNIHKRLRVEIRVDVGPPDGDFQKLPDELILKVMSYLDLQSLCRSAQVNRRFSRVAVDTTLYRTIDLRAYWHCISDEILNILSQRCNRNLQKVDISWCGSHEMVEPPCIAEFLDKSGRQLKHVRLNCCRLVDTPVLKSIAEHSLLQELCLRYVVGAIDWQVLRKLTMLKRLDLYRTDVTGSAAASILKRNPYLEHLNLGSCNSISNMDEVMKTIGRYCPNLIFVDFWKSYSLTPCGMRELGRCRKLQHLDVGWCLQIGGSGSWLQWLDGSELTKVLLAALRDINDTDLRWFIPRVPKLMRLDLLGMRSITPGICSMILAECKHLRLLDVSYCDLIKESQVMRWRHQYPLVCIRRVYESQAMYESEPEPDRR